MATFNGENLSQDHRYSRQSYTIGKDAQTKLSNAAILVIGYNTLAQEIIRNLALIGVAKIDIHVNSNEKNQNTTGLYYPISNDTLPLNDLSKLNPTIKIECVNILDADNELDKKKFVSQYNLIILTNSVLDDAIEINRITHKFEIPFIMCGTYGLMGYMFNDFGENFTITDLDGETSEPLILDSITTNDDKTKTLLKFKDEHKLSQGDVIIVSDSNGVETELEVHRKKSPLIVELKTLSSENKNDYDKILRKKMSQIFNFKSLKKNMSEPVHNVSDWSVGMNRSILLHRLHLLMNDYLNEFGDLPRPWSILDWELYYTKYLSKLENILSESDIKLAKKFCFTSRGDVLPISSVIGGIVSHEVFKVLAHKYIPIQQWYYMDYLDLILDSEIEQHIDHTCRNYKTKTKYDGIVNVFGKKFLESVQNTVPFVIGSGAIGCELIKNLGMMGIKKIYLTDPDHVEKSNLSRQFLFNDNDIRQSKSETASKKMKMMNPDIEIIGLVQKMCKQTENYFNEKFHSEIDIYLNALDNIDARMYMDSMAIKYSKPLIDSGTMGSKGNVQIIIPHLTESYGSSKDPDEKAGIPICTIKAFPYKPEHTIQWARELFETEFNLIPSLIAKYKDINELNKINDADAKQLLKYLYKYQNFKPTNENFDKILGTIWRENFHDNIREIIEKYSKDENKEELGDKKLPKYLTHEYDNHMNRIEFYKFGFGLLNQIFNSNVDFTNHKKNDQTILLSHQPFNYELDDLDSEKIIEILSPIIETIPQITPIEFEKDDDELGHVQWVSLCSNMRNYQYSIPETDLWNVRKTSGNLIPALNTTTTLITGFHNLELLRCCKLYQPNKYLSKENNSDINMYKNRFLNLNTNYCDGINPSAAMNYKLENDTNISIWTKLKTSHVNTKEIINQIEMETKKKIEFMTCGNKTVYDGDEISIDNIDFNKDEDLLVLLEDIPIGIPLIYSDA